ncbi:MAG: DotI/IcmL/TraM family protein [Gammaproteobacteria bacterium]|nr:DotI/IcmL/TraM family protein [Gammaproteobacteria bacterium]
MKRSLLGLVVLAALNGTSYAEDSNPNVNIDTNPPAAAPGVTAPTVTTPAETTPAATAPQPTATTPEPVTAAPAPTPEPMTATPDPVATTPAPDAMPPAPTTTTSTTDMPVPDTIDCTYAISPQVTQINPSIITKWASKAAEQAFTFESTQINAQLEQLKLCFTNQGWTGFKDALNKSGNLPAIQSQGLTMSAMTQGTPVLTETKTNEWKVSFPLQVVYQNKQQKLTQDLNIELLIGRKLTGDLGIMQLIASSKPAAAPEAAAPATTTKPN